MKKDTYILAIETSCDETSMAIIKNGTEEIALTILTQMDTHAEFGGVVPEIASRMHTENITLVLEDTLIKSGMDINEIDAIAVTAFPGLTGSLLIGIECAKVLSFVFNKPLIAVNHMVGHIYANALNNKMNYPLIALVVSGGHSNLVLMEEDYDFQVVGKTLDDAVGEAFDKIARVLDLPYPGGPSIEKLAKLGKNTYNLPVPMNNNSLDFSFSGLKSSVINLVHNEKQKGNEINKEDLACSFQEVAIQSLVNKTELAIKKYKVKNVIVAGGVSANSHLREELDKLTSKYNINLSIPEFKYCTDNAAMIGAAAYPMFLRDEFSDLTLNAKSKSKYF